MKEQTRDGPQESDTRANTSVDDATKAALSDKKGKAILADDALQAATENDGVLNNQHPQT
jgi:hypothetical protein